MPYQEYSDASFFSLVHHVLEAARPVEVDERRDNQRRAFTLVQLIAPYHDGRLPRESDFRPVRCHDLSPTGFSFYADASCPDEYLVVALGAAPPIFVSAVVVHQRPVQVEGREVLLVGCRFMTRLTQPGFGASSQTPSA